MNRGNERPFLLGKILTLSLKGDITLYTVHRKFETLAKLKRVISNADEFGARYRHFRDMSFRTFSSTKILF